MGLIEQLRKDFERAVEAFNEALTLACFNEGYIEVFEKELREKYKDLVK
jgi:hypothetical protein